MARLTGVEPQADPGPGVVQPPMLVNDQHIYWPLMANGTHWLAQHALDRAACRAFSCVDSHEPAEAVAEIR